MNTLILLGLFSHSLSQSLVWKIRITSLQNKDYFVWDYFDGKLIYFSNATEYICDAFSRICNVYKRIYIPTTYIARSKYYFINDVTYSRTCRFGYDGRTHCHPFLGTQYLQEFQSIFINEKYFYIQTSFNRHKLAIHDITKWETQIPPLIVYLESLEAPWNIKDGGIYAVKVAQGINIVKYSLDGNNQLWMSTFPECQTNDPKNEVLFAAKESNVFVVCSTVNIMAIFNSNEGNIIEKYAVDKGKVVALETSEEFVFILYEEGSIVQYTLDFNYVYTYSVDNMNAPKYRMLRADKEFLFTVLCNNQEGYEYCFIHQWSIYSVRNPVTVAYHRGKSLASSINATLRVEPSVILSRKISILETISTALDKENSFFTPLTYKDNAGQDHIIFFSGGRVFWKGLCGDVFVHDMLIKKEREKFILTALPFYPISEIRNPLQDYAATLVKDKLIYFYVIHGGISCDYQTIYSDLFAIQVLDNLYIKLSQNYSMTRYFIC
jgi:hypothetical protein